MNRRKVWNCEILWWQINLDKEMVRRLRLKDQAFKEKK